MLRKIISMFLIFGLFFQQACFAQLAAELNLSGYLARMQSGFTIDKFRPLHLRYFNYDLTTHDFNVLVDKGDLKSLQAQDLEISTKELLEYFQIGLSLNNESFWVNLRPDSEDQIIDPYLAQTDVGKIMLETDLQLKKDTARLTSPETPEGKEYWNRLYKKAEELFGYENISIPTLTRPWIVPGEIIIHETDSSAYIYKATLKVMLEQDYLKGSAQYNFKDPRQKVLNEYSSELIRELIIPKLTKEVNSSKRYAQIRQVYYSLILSRWFKNKFQGQSGGYASRINTLNLSGLTSKTPWSKTTYFKDYQKSFKDGEYNIKEPVYTPTGQVVRSYFSGGWTAVEVPYKQGIIGSSPMKVIPETKTGVIMNFNGDGTIGVSSPISKKNERLFNILQEAFKNAIGQVKNLSELESLLEFQKLSNVIVLNPSIVDRLMIDLGLGPKKDLDSQSLSATGDFEYLIKKIDKFFHFLEDRKDKFSERHSNIKKLMERITGFGTKEAQETIKSMLESGKSYWDEEWVLLRAIYGIEKTMDTLKRGIIEIRTDNPSLERYISDSYIGTRLDKVSAAGSPLTAEQERIAKSAEKIFEKVKDLSFSLSVYDPHTRDAFLEKLDILDKKIIDAFAYEIGELWPLAEKLRNYIWRFGLSITQYPKFDKYNGYSIIELDEILSKLKTTGEHSANELHNMLFNLKVTLLEIMKTGIIPGAAGLPIARLDSVDGIISVLDVLSQATDEQSKKSLKQTIEIIKPFGLNFYRGDEEKYSLSDAKEYLIFLRQQIVSLNEKVNNYLLKLSKGEKPHSAEERLFDKTLEELNSLYKAVDQMYASVIKLLPTEDKKEAVVKSNSSIQIPRVGFFLWDQRLGDPGLAGFKTQFYADSREGKATMIAPPEEPLGRERTWRCDFHTEDILAGYMAKLKLDFNNYGRDYFIKEFKRIAVTYESASSAIQGQSPSIPEIERTGTVPGEFGGIDFRSLPMTIKPMGSFEGLNLRLPQLSSSALTSFNVSEEIQQLNQMASSGIMPSGSRVQELVSAAWQKGELEEYQSEILTLLAEICKLQEGECCEASDELKVALVVANAV